MRAALILCLAAACSVPDKSPIETDGGVEDAMPTDTIDDDEAPETTLQEVPEMFSREGLARFVFSSDEADVTFECSIDGDAPIPCTSPYTRSLGNGNHSFLVRAIDAAGNGDDTPAEHLWTIDTVAPDTQLVEKPPVADNSVMVTFGFKSAEANVSFDCALDNGSYSPCQSGATFGPVGDGPHSFAVRARDRAGNMDASPAIYAWSVDTSTPDTQLLSGPVGATGSQTASFTFVSPDAGGGATFQCSLDNSAWVACTSPRNYSALTMGVHTFEVRVRDAVGNYDPTPATRTWSVDLTPPNTTIVSGPTGTQASASATFTFSSNEANSTFECKLDTGTYAACTSPANFTSLAQGPHTFAVRAIDSAGHPDATPAARTWTVDTAAPTITITAGPPANGVSGPYVVVAFTVSDGVVACSLDNAAFTACTSPLEWNLPAGPHNIRIRATDAAGNVEIATRAWTVACAAPGPAGAAGLLHLDDQTQTLANAVTGGIAATLGDDGTVEPVDPTQIAARFDGGLDFTSTENDHASWPAALGALGAFTLEVWSRPDSAGGTRELVNTGDGRVSLRVVAVSPTTVRYNLTVVETDATVRTVSSAVVSAGSWHHVLASLQEPTIRLWVDGAGTELAGVAMGGAALFDAIRIGGDGTTAYSGSLDEVWLAPTAIVADDAARARYCPL